MNSLLEKYTLVLRSPDEPSGAPAPASPTSAPVQPSAPPAPAASGSSDASPSPSPMASPSDGSPSASTPLPSEAPQADAATAPKSAPSLLEAAAATKRAGAPEPAPVGAKPAEAAPAAPEGDKPATAEKAKEAAPADAPKPDAAPTPPQAPATEPQAVDYTWTVPEGIKLDDARTTEFKGILAEHHAPAELAPKLMDMYVAEATRLTGEIRQQQQDAWEQYQERQLAAFRADPDVGGNRQDTSLGIAKGLIEQFGGTPDQVQALIKDLTYTGMGNNANIVRLLNNIDRVLAEGSLVPAPTPSPTRGRSWKERAYGGNGQAPG